MECKISTLCIHLKIYDDDGLQNQTKKSQNISRDLLCIKLAEYPAWQKATMLRSNSVIKISEEECLVD